MVVDEDRRWVAKAVENGQYWFGQPEKKTNYEFVAVHPGFLGARDLHPSRTEPIAVTLLRSLAFKVALALIWDAGGAGGTKHRGAVSLVPLSLATLVGLRADEINDLQAESARRSIVRALEQLEDEGLLKITEQQTRWRMRVLRTDGSGKAWRNESQQNAAGQVRYVRVPAALLRNGWLAVLSNAAVHSLLVLVHQWGIQSRQWPVQTGAALIEGEYDINADTFRKGVRELEGWGLVARLGRTQVRIRPGKNGYATQSRWTLDLDRLRAATPLQPDAILPTSLRVRNSFEPVTHFGKKVHGAE